LHQRPHLENRALHRYMQLTLEIISKGHNLKKNSSLNKTREVLRTLLFETTFINFSFWF